MESRTFICSFPSVSRDIYIYYTYTYTLSFLFSVSVHVLSQCDISRTSPRATWFNSHAFLLRRSLCSFCSFTLSFPFRLCSSSLHQVLHPFCPFPCIWPRFLRSTDPPPPSLLLSLSPDTMRRRPSSVNEFWRSPGPLTIASRLTCVYAREPRFPFATWRILTRPVSKYELIPVSFFTGRNFLLVTRGSVEKYPGERFLVNRWSTRIVQKFADAFSKINK